MNARWLILAMLAVTMFTATGCASSRHGRYGPYGRSGSVYDQRRVYSQRDYQLQRQRREREAWLRQQRRHERHERRRAREWNKQRRWD